MKHSKRDVRSDLGVAKATKLQQGFDCVLCDHMATVIKISQGAAEVYGMYTNVLFLNCQML